jgi:hypothetical protein
MPIIKNTMQKPYSAIVISMKPNKETEGLTAEVLTVTNVIHEKLGDSGIPYTANERQIDSIFLGYDPSTKVIDWAGAPEQKKIDFSDSIEKAIDGYHTNNTQQLNDRIHRTVLEREGKITSAGCISFIEGSTYYSIFDITKLNSNEDAKISEEFNASGFLPDEVINEDYSFFKWSAEHFLDECESINDFTLTIRDSGDTPFSKIESSVFGGTYEPLERLANISCTKDFEKISLDVYFTQGMDMTFIRVPPNGINKFVDEAIRNEFSFYNPAPGVYETMSLTLGGQESWAFNVITENILIQYGLDSFGKIKDPELTGVELRRFPDEFYVFLVDNHIEALAEYSLYNSLVNLSNGGREANPGENPWVPVAESFASDPYASSVDMREAWGEFQAMQKNVEVAIEQQPSRLQVAHQAIQQALLDYGLGKPLGNPLNASGQPVDLQFPEELTQVVEPPKHRREDSPRL